MVCRSCSYRRVLWHFFLNSRNCHLVSSAMAVQGFAIDVSSDNDDDDGFRFDWNYRKGGLMMLQPKKCAVVFFVCFICLSVFWYTACNWPTVFRYVSQIPLVGWFVAYNFEPSDFYAPLAEVPLREGESQLRFKAKYYGRHEIRISPLIDASVFETSISMKIKVRDSSGAVVCEHNQASAQLMGGALVNGTNIYNYCYAIFYAPNDFQLGDEMQAEVECSGDVSEILKHNPNAMIAVSKAFDK